VRAWNLRRIIGIAEALTNVNLQAYVVATILLGVMVLGLTFISTAYVSYREIVSPLWGLKALSSFYSADTNSSSGILVAFTMLPALIALTCMSMRSRALIIANASISRVDVLAASYFIVLVLTLGIAAYTAIYWGTIKYSLLACRNVDPLTFALGAAAIVTAFTLPTMLEGVAISSIIAAKVRYGLLEAFALFIALLFILPVVDALSISVGMEVMHSAALPEYVMSAIVPGEGFARLTAIALGVPNAAEPGVNYMVVAAMSTTSLAITILAGTALFIRSAEVRGA